MIEKLEINEFALNGIEKKFKDKINEIIKDINNLNQYIKNGGYDFKFTGEEGHKLTLSELDEISMREEQEDKCIKCNDFHKSDKYCNDCKRLNYQWYQPIQKPKEQDWKKLLQEVKNIQLDVYSGALNDYKNKLYQIISLMEKEIDKLALSETLNRDIINNLDDSCKKLEKENQQLKQEIENEKDENIRLVNDISYHRGRITELEEQLKTKQIKIDDDKVPRLNIILDKAIKNKDINDITIIHIKWLKDIQQILQQLNKE